MRVAVLLHGAAVVRGPRPLHPADENLVAACRRLALEVVAVELVGATGVAPRAMNDALAAGADRGVRVVAEALVAADAHATGLVAERALGSLDADVTLFAPDADPEGLADVPAVIAWRLGTAYVPGLVVFGAAEETTSAPGQPTTRLTAVAERAGALVRIEIPPKAVVGVELDVVVSAPSAAEGAAEPEVRTPPAALQILSLSDLGLEPTQVRRGYDQRGVIEAASRPLVTTRSVESLAALLR